MDDRDLTQPELPVLAGFTAPPSPGKPMPAFSGQGDVPERPATPESGYDPYNSAP
jgi:hypothetical protein